MAGEKDRQVNEVNGGQGPKVAKSDKSNIRLSGRIILVFLLLVGLLIAVITLQANFNRPETSSQGREKSYRAPQASGFAELAAGMRRDRKPVQVMASGDERKPEPARRIVIEAPKNTSALPQHYYSDKNDAQAANTLRTLKLQALTAKPVVENFELKQDGKTEAATQRAASAPNTMTGGAHAAGAAG